MSIRTTIQKILFGAIVLLICGSVLTLLIAANGNKSKNICSGYNINIRGSADDLFVNEEDVLKLISSGTGGKIKDEPLSSFNLRGLEKLLQDNVWIRDAELWFDSKDVLHIQVKEREPIARIFTTANQSFYIDASLQKMPLSERLSARVPMFTGFPEKKIYTKKDSALLIEVRDVASFIHHDPFWDAQISQVDITSDRVFEMVPLVGNHLVRLGNAKDLDKKFNRLMIFYRQVLSKTGFDSYSTIDIQYEGQVIGTRKGSSKTPVDSLQLKMNVERLLNQIERVKKEEEALNKKVTTEKPPIEAHRTLSADSKTTAPLPNSAAANREAGDPNAMKTTTVPHVKPKAIMPKPETRNQKQETANN